MASTAKCACSTQGGKEAKAKSCEEKPYSIARRTQHVKQQAESYIDVGRRLAPETTGGPTRPRKSKGKVPARSGKQGFGYIAYFSVTTGLISFPRNT